MSAGSDPNRLESLVLLSQKLITPLMASVVASRSGEEVDATAEAETLAGLVDSTTSLAADMATALGASKDGVDDFARWELAGAAAEMVAAFQKADDKAPDADLAQKIAQVAGEMAGKLALPEDLPTGQMDPRQKSWFRARAVASFVPIVAAVARFSFGYEEHLLLAEVVGRIQSSVDEVMKNLVSVVKAPEDWPPLHAAILRSAGQLYADAHYAEMDRLLDMDPEERMKFAAQYGGHVPLKPVWEAFDARMSMLTAIALNLDVPENAGIVPPSRTAA